MRLLLISMLLSFILTNCPSQNGTDAVDMRATVSPQRAGVVNPPAGTYYVGREITIETQPSDSSWSFTGWSGDTTSSDDSLTFVITQEVNLVANYLQMQAFSDSITVSDGNDSKKLIFGMNPNATAGFDEGIDKKLPPRPPEGSFYRRFNITDYGLKKDLRPVQAKQTVWEIEFAPDDGQSITLKWDFNGIVHSGSLILTDDISNPSFEVDMKSTTSREVGQSADTLFVVSN